MPPQALNNAAATAELAAALLQARQTILPKRLGAPGPDAAQLQAILAAAAHAPDHGCLLPWRFVLVPDAARAALGQAFADALRERDAQATPEQQEQAREKAVRVLKPETSEALRYVMRLNAVKGSASKAAVPGYFVGGKTGTAEKVIGGRYSKNRLFTTFMATTPADKPRYLFVTVYDEPQPTPESGGYATAAWNAGETTGRILERIAPMLSIPPRFDPPQNPFPLMAKLGAWGTR